MMIKKKFKEDKIKSGKDKRIKKIRSSKITMYINKNFTAFIFQRNSHFPSRR